jgi:hypothetical protein
MAFTTGLWETGGTGLNPLLFHGANVRRFLSIDRTRDLGDSICVIGKRVLADSRLKG